MDSNKRDNDNDSPIIEDDEESPRDQPTRSDPPKREKSSPKKADPPSEKKDDDDDDDNSGMSLGAMLTMLAMMSAARASSDNEERGASHSHSHGHSHGASHQSRTASHTASRPTDSNRKDPIGYLIDKVRSKLTRDVRKVIVYANPIPCACKGFEWVYMEKPDVHRLAGISTKTKDYILEAWKTLPDHKVLVVWKDQDEVTHRVEVRDL